MRPPYKLFRPGSERFRRLKFAPLLVLLAIAAPWRASGPSVGNIEGFVRDEQGSPVTGATLQAFDIMRGGCCTVTSQANGFYRIADLIPGRYSLWVEAKGHSSKWLPRVVVEEGRSTRTDIRLRREVPRDETEAAATY